jgi:ribosomal protein RSM22 (predicted rRNA methylase)
MMSLNQLYRICFFVADVSLITSTNISNNTLMESVKNDLSTLIRTIYRQLPSPGTQHEHNSMAFSAHISNPASPPAFSTVPSAHPPSPALSSPERGSPSNFP